MTPRKFIFWTHLVIGVTFGVIILSMCATGALLSFEPQIIDFVERDLRSVPLPHPPARRLSLETVFDRARDVMPKGRTTGIQLDPNPHATARVRFGREGTVYVDPYSGRVLGKDSETQRTFKAIERWHRWLGSKKIGKPITGATAVVFLGLTVSGLFLWTTAPAATTRLRSGLNGRARTWNQHTAIGFWSSGYLLVITFTGIWLSYGATHPAWLVPIHTGSAWGWPGQLLNLLTVLGGWLLIWTGFALAWRRFKGRKT